MGSSNEHSLSNRRIHKTYFNLLKSAQLNFIQNENKSHIFRNDGFFPSSWKFNLIEDLKNSGSEIHSWKDEIINALGPIEGM